MNIFYKLEALWIKLVKKICHKQTWQLLLSWFMINLSLGKIVSCLCYDLYKTAGECTDAWKHQWQLYALPIFFETNCQQWMNMSRLIKTMALANWLFKDYDLWKVTVCWSHGFRHNDLYKILAKWNEVDGVCWWIGNSDLYKSEICNNWSSIFTLLMAFYTLESSEI